MSLWFFESYTYACVYIVLFSNIADNMVGILYT